MSSKKIRKLWNRRKLHHPPALHQAVQAHPHLAHPLHRQVNVILLREVAPQAAHQAQAAAAAQTLAAAHQAHQAHQAAHPAVHLLTLHLPNRAILTLAKTSTRTDQT